MTLNSVIYRDLLTLIVEVEFGGNTLVISSIKKGLIPKAKIINPPIDQTETLSRLSGMFEEK